MRPWSREKKESPNPLFLTLKRIEILENTFKDILEYLKFWQMCSLVNVVIYINKSSKSTVYHLLRRQYLFHSPFLFIKL